MARRPIIIEIQFQVDDRPEVRLEKLRRLARDLASLSEALQVGEASGNLPDITGPSVLGRITGVGQPIELTIPQLRVLIGDFSANVAGLVPAPGPATGRFLRDDGAWATAGGSGDGYPKQLGYAGIT